MRITILLAEDERSVRELFCHFLSEQPDLQVVAAVGDGRAAVEEARRKRPDVALIDIGLPEMNGIEAARHIHDELPDTRILALSVYDNETTLGEMFKAGACGYLSKAVSLDKIVAAIRVAMLGERPILRQFGGRIISTTRPAASDTYEPVYEHLSPRLIETLQLIAEGCSTKQIADKMSISPDTVASYRKQLMEKLGMHSSVELTRYAIQEGLTELKPPAE